jgi:uncharacterized Zn-finger protein
MASTEKTTAVSKQALPFSCPQKDTPAWNMHPRVYIDLSDKKGANCPYCGAHYQLVSD